jgi:hypothetical protein
MIANEEHTQCLRCLITSYALMDGVCLKNDGSEQFPLNCIQYAYNETSRAFYCKECDRGYGISANNTRCVINSGGCVDSVEKDCYQYEALAGFEEII